MERNPRDPNLMRVLAVVCLIEVVVLVVVALLLP
jgi:hypothetical protein